jgi:hypothetical protein
MDIIESPAVIQMLFTVIWLNYTLVNRATGLPFKSFHTLVKIVQHLCVYTQHIDAAQNTRFADQVGRWRACRWNIHERCASSFLLQKQTAAPRNVHYARTLRWEKNQCRRDMKRVHPPLCVRGA